MAAVGSNEVWQPLALFDVVGLFENADFPWWIAGGLALELHLGCSWREHADIDVSVRRGDAGKLAAILDGWDIHVAAAGALTQWQGEALDASPSQNNLWCRRNPSAPWALDVTISDGDERDWIFRRDPTIRLAWDEAVLTTTEGVPYLAPELQLLFKAKNVRPKDTVDAERVIGRLGGHGWHPCSAQNTPGMPSPAGLSPSRLRHGSPTMLYRSSFCRPVGRRRRGWSQPMITSS